MSRPLHELLRALDAEIRALQLLQYRHQVCALLLSVADHRHLTMAADELEQAEEEVAEIDLGRAMAANTLAEFWDLGSDSITLSLLLTRATDHEAQLLVERQEQLCTSMQQLEELKSLANELATASLGEIQGRVTQMENGEDASPPTYDKAPRHLVASVQRHA